MELRVLILKDLLNFKRARWDYHHHLKQGGRGTECLLEWACAWQRINDVRVCVCQWICQIINQRLDKDHMCASLCISPTYRPHIPLHACAKPYQQECKDRLVSSGDIMAGCQTQQQGLSTSFLLVTSATWCQAVDQWHPLQPFTLYESLDIHYRQAIDETWTIHKNKCFHISHTIWPCSLKSNLFASR